MAKDRASDVGKDAELAAGATLPAAVTPPQPSPADTATSGWDAEHLPVLAEDQRYQLAAELARGGLGRVLRARDRRLDRDIVLKELLAAGPGVTERFLREARITARLQHPAIVPVHDAGRWPNGVPFYAMKEVSGPSLEDVIKRAASLEERLGLLPILVSVAEAIAYAHSERIIHRDLKPANVVVGPFGETVVIDWGLAKDLAERRPDTAPAEGSASMMMSAVSAQAAEGQTLDGAVMGTPAYMPPEQARGERVDERADVYALGALLYHLLAGAAPYRGATSRHILKQVLAEPPPPLRARQPDVPQDLVSIVAKAMARDPADRYPSARGFAEDLKRFTTGQLVGSHRYSPRELVWRFLARHRAEVAVALASLAVLVTLAVLGVRKIAHGRAEAEAQRAEAEQHEDELVLLQARSAVEKDPTAALAWLKEYPELGPDAATARAIAIDAVNRGVATQVLSGHTGMIWRLAFSPDGARLASASADGTIRLWDLAHGTSRVLTGHATEVDCLAFSPDGTLLVSGSDDKTVRVWDVATGGSRVLTGHTGSVIEVAWFKDGKTFATASYDRTIRFWDAAAGTSRLFVELPMAGDLNQLAIAPDERTLAVVGKDHNLYLVDVPSGMVHTLTGHTSIVRGVAYAPDGRSIATASYDKTVRLWDTATGASRELTGHEGRVYTVAFSPDGTRLASASEDETVRLWDLASGGESRVLHGHQGLVSTVTFSPDGKRLATAGFDKRIRVWDVPPFESRAFRGYPPGPTRAAAFAADGKHLAFAAADGTLSIADAATGEARAVGVDATGWLILSPNGATLGTIGDDKLPRAWDTATGRAFAFPTTGPDACANPLDLVFSADGTRAVVDCAGWSLRVWTPATGAVKTFGGYKESVQSMAFSPDGAWVGSTCGTEVWVWSLLTGEKRVLSGHEGWVAPGFRFSPDSTRVASASNDQTVRVWDLASGRAQVLRGHESGLRDVAFSPDGTRVVSAGYDKIVRVWDLARGTSQALVGHRATVHHVAFAPDGRLVASASSADRIIRLWDTRTGASRVLAGHTDAISDLAFAPDGTALLSTGNDQTVRLWTTAVGAVPPASVSLRAWLDTLTSAVLDGDHLPTSP